MCITDAVRALGPSHRQRRVGSIGRHDGPRARGGAASTSPRWRPPTRRTRAGFGPGCRRGHRGGLGRVGSGALLTHGGIGCPAAAMRHAPTLATHDASPWHSHAAAGPSRTCSHGALCLASAEAAELLILARRWLVVSATLRQPCKSSQTQHQKRLTLGLLSALGSPRQHTPLGSRRWRGG